MKNLILTAIGFILLIFGFTYSGDYKNKTPEPTEIYVQRVVDGDTFISQGTTYRVAEIDAPEKNQTFGRESKLYLTKLIQNKNVKVFIKSTDKYHRKIVCVYIYKTKLSEILIENGYAWHYKRYSKNQQLAELEISARKNKKGLWKYNHIEPYQFRKRNKY